MIDKESTKTVLGELQTKVSMLSQEINCAQLILEELVKLSAAEDMEQSIQSTLKTIGSYLEAERIHIFEERGECYANVFEWCQEGVAPIKDILPSLKKEELKNVTSVLAKGACIVLKDIEEIQESQPEWYAFLEKHKIKNTVETPIIVKQQLIGFLGVDNASGNITQLMENLLSALGAFLGDYIQIRQEKEEIQRKDQKLAQEKKRYREALSNKCDYCFSFDVSEGLITSEFVTSYGINLLKQLKLSVPVSFDEMNRYFMDAYGVKLLEGEYAPNFTCQGLLEQFENGITNVVSKYFIPSMGIYTRTSALLSRDDQTGHVHAVVIANDITESRKKELAERQRLLDTKENLDAVNQKLRVALEMEQEKTAIITAISNVYFFIYSINCKDGIMAEVSGVPYVNEFIAVSHSPQEVVSTWIHQVMEEESWEKLEKFTDFTTLSERLSGLKSINCECLSKKNGWIRISFIPVVENAEGELEQVLWVAQRIDAEKRKELAQQEALQEAYDAANKANAVKTDFLASMSHDIRTPMNAIIGMTAIAATHLDDRERVADCLSKITVSSKHLLGLINEVLDMSKIESGKVDLHEEEFSLVELIDNLLIMVKPQVEAMKHNLSVTIHGIEHEKVIGDSQRIQQSFMNLMSNAIKYTPEGGNIKLSICEKPVNKSKFGCYEFIFEDNGIGMSEEFVEHLFEPFARATDSRVEKIQGTGLGMAITKNMVRMMNGDINVESQLDKGTKITVNIILRLQDADEAIPYEEFADLSILVVDDDNIACETACEVLKELGMKSEWVLSGREAVELVAGRHEKEEDFFAVILDWKMPGMDGIETTKEIRRRMGKDAPIIIISTYDCSDIEVEARAAGANAFISKPLFKSKMAHLFKDFLGLGNKEVKEESLHSIIKSDFTGRRVLLTEDNDLNAEIAGEVLGMAGLTVDFAKNGKEALDIMSTVEENYYDIIFMDIQMPIMNGYDACRAIRALPGNYVKRVPIIAMTANAFSDDVEAARRAGMNQHMAKPLNFNHLMEVLRHWLG